MAENAEATHFFKLSDQVYDVLSGLVKYVLPGAATLYLALAALWVLPAGEQVAGTIMAITTFLGIILGISKRSYLALTPATDGDLLVELQEEGSDYLTVALDRPLDEVKGLDVLTLKVVTNKSAQE